jgi:hypothetical protein
LDALIPGQSMVKEAPVSLALDKALQALLFNLVVFCATLTALAGAPVVLDVHPPRVLPLDVSVSFLEVAEPGTRGGLKLTVAVKLVQVMVPFKVGVLAEATPAPKVNKVTGMAMATATVRHVRTRRIGLPPRVSVQLSPLRVNANILKRS